MYICVCNGISDKQVRTAVRQGAETVGRVFKSQGCKPECAQCVSCIRDIIEDEVLPSQILCAAE